MREIEIYTDGACEGNPGRGAYGIVLLYNGTRKELSGGYKLTTNNRMELMGVIKALAALKEPCKIKLYSDSKYVVDAIRLGWAEKWKKNNWMRTKKDKALNSDLWENLLNLLKIHHVEFIWVKGHADNIENERCDFLAVSHIKTGILGVDEKYENNR